MEELYGVITTLSQGTSSDLLQLQRTLKANESVLRAYAAPLLDALDPQLHSLAWLHLLSAEYSLAPNTLDPALLCVLSQRFFIHCTSSQVMVAPDMFVRLCHTFARNANNLGQALSAVKPLEQAIAKMQLSQEYLTPVHAIFLFACICSKTYVAALPVLEVPIYKVAPTKTALTPRDVLLYFYYGGCIYAALKRWRKALDFFQGAITTPATALSAIVHEAYKKFTLASLMVHGRTLSLPKCTPSVAVRNLKRLCVPYVELSNAFATFDSDELRKVVEAHREEYEKDGNYGLVKQCIHALNRLNVQRLTQTFLTLSLEDIASTVKLSNPKEAERLLLLMIEKREIFASINQQNRMVSFHEDPEQYDGNATLERLDHEVKEAIHVSTKAALIGEELSTDTRYVQRTAGPGMSLLASDDVFLGRNSYLS